MRGPWFEYERFAVWGLGRSGVAASNLLALRGKSVIATDPGKEMRPDDLDSRVDFAKGPNVLGDAQLLVVSPGLPPSSTVFDGVEIPIVSEVEIGWAACATPFVAITGTDGKTTTTELTAHIAKHAGQRVIAAGNIGLPLTAVADDELDLVVAEISAFQLWSTDAMTVEAAAFTNLAADHLDYFESWDEYVAAKRRLLDHAAGQWAVFNFDDPIIRTWIDEHDGPKAVFSLRGRPPVEADLRVWLEPERGVIYVDHGTLSSLNYLSVRALQDAGIRGMHNVANVMAATALAHTRGIGLDRAAEAVMTFEVGPHRIEYVDTVHRVAYYDDSKATNANAALAGVQSLSGKLVVIAGGVDKGIDLDLLAEELTHRARAVVLIGEIRGRFREALERAGMPTDRLHEADSMPDAVSRASALARAGDNVLLSPACSSFDMFESYAHRGRAFQDAVRSLPR